MTDYIQIPPMLYNLHDIKSKNLQDFLLKFQDGKLSLAVLRELYREDREHFFQIIEEFTLRGFRFHTEKSNNILPNKTIDISSYIAVADNQNRFQSIPFSDLGLSGFIRRFNIDSDLFFNKVPLEGFTYINASVELDELKRQFVDAGFLFIATDAEEVLQPTTIDMTTLSPVQIVAETVDEDELTNNGVTKEEAPVELIFHDGIFISFRQFCRQNRIDTISQITPELLQRYSEMKGVGVAKVKAVHQRLDEIRQLGPNSSSVNESYEQTQELQFVGNIEISSLFQERKYAMFRAYCAQHRLTWINELNREHIDKFSRMNGVGKKKVQDILAVLNGYSKKAGERFESGDIFHLLQRHTISAIAKAYHIPIQASNAMTLDDIEGKELDELEGIFGRDALVDLSIRLKNQKTPNRLIRDLRNKLDARELEIINLRNDKYQTLESIAQIFGITRQRVQQIILKTKQKIKAEFERENFLTIIQLISSHEHCIDETELLDLIGEENDFLLLVFKQEDDVLYYYDKLDLFFFDPAEVQLSRIDELLDELPNEFRADEYHAAIKEELVQNGITFADNRMIEMLLSRSGFTKYGEVYARNRFTTLDVFEYLFKYRIDQPIRMDDDGLRYVQGLAEQYLDYKLEGNPRALISRLRDSENIILVDSLTFQWFNPDDFDITLVERIDEYLTQRLQVTEVVNASDVYQAFEKELVAFNITNKFHLYSIIRYFLDEKYKIGQGNTLNIYASDGTKLSREEVVIQTLARHQGIATTDQLKEELNWPSYRLEQTISKSQNIMQWGKKQVMLFESLGMTNELKEAFVKLTQSTMKQGFTSAAVVLEEMRFNRELSVLIRDKGINDVQKITSVIKILLPDVKGFSNFLYMEGCPYESFEDVIVDHFQEETSRSEIKEFAYSYGYKEMMASNFIKRLLNERIFVEIDLDQLYPAHKLDISAEIVAEVKSFITEKMADKPYLSLSHLRGYRKALPVFEYRWNPHLIASIITAHGYRQIKKIYNDYRYDKVIIVKEDSHIQSFEDLVHYIIQHEYDGNMHEIKIYEYLAEMGILNSHDTNDKKVLPYEVRNQGKINIDELGFVTLK